MQLKRIRRKVEITLVKVWQNEKKISMKVRDRSGTHVFQESNKLLKLSPFFCVAPLPSLVL